jgi:hypothetical protein
MRWDIPDPQLFTDKSHPVAVLIPSVGMKDLDGNGLSVRSQLRDLSRALNSVGFATFRFASPQETRELELAELITFYEKAFDHPDVNRDQTILLGVGDAADRIARHYYDFFRVQPPAAAVLLSPSVLAFHLNNFTCPYLLIHGSQDPLIAASGYEKIESAVHHHEIRYGDSTESKLITGVGKELGQETLSPAVLEEIKKWVGPLRYSRAKRPQERVAA